MNIYIYTYIYIYFFITRSMNLKTVLQCHPMSAWCVLQQHKTLYNWGHSSRLFLQCKTDYIIGDSIRKLDKAVAVSRVFSGVPKENSRKKFGQGPAFAPNRKMLWIRGFGVPGKANLPRTLGWHCPEPCPNLLLGMFLEIDSHSLLEFFWYTNDI